MSTIFDDVILLSSKVQPVPMTEVESLEQHLGVALPSGYREFITRFGEGDYGDLISISSPARIREEYASHREFLKDYEYHKFYERGDHILSPDQLQACILIGNTMDGDYIEYYPPLPDRVFVLPRHDDKIHILNADFSDLHSWIRAEPLLKIFMPWRDQTYLECNSISFTLDQATCLAKFQQRWDDPIMLHEQSDAWSWQLIFFLPAIGGRVQFLQDEGVGRTIQQRNGVTATKGGNGARSLFIRIDLDKDAMPDVRAFLDDLQSEGLLTLHRRP